MSNFVNTFENLFDVFVDGEWILALTDDFKQIFIGNEVESGEDTSLAFQEGTQFFLDGLKTTIHLEQSLCEIFLCNY
jgi:hypothetical protein